MSTFKMAWRNMWRNSRRTLVTMAAIAFGLWVMVLYTGLVTGLLAGMEADVIDYEVGEIQVFADGYRDDPSIYTRIDDSETLIAGLEREGFQVSPQLLGGALAAAGDASSRVALRGVDLEREGTVLKVRQRIAEGAWLDASDPKGVVLGWRLARTLAVRAGDEVIVLSQASDGSMANDLYTVRGTLSSVGDATDRAAMFLLAETFRELMVVPDGVHQLILRSPDGMELAAAAERVEFIDPSVEALTWRELLPIVAGMLDSTASLVYMIFFIVYIAIGILILNAMLMAVFERIREFGVLKAIGTGPGMVFRLLLAETFLQTLFASMIGLALSAPFAWFLQEHGLNVAGLAGTPMMGLTMPPTWRGVYGPEAVGGPSSVLVLIVGLAAIYPAAKAALIKPIDAMRYR
jgi:ABC-type lipoprotein release transport system permease subunit